MIERVWETIERFGMFAGARRIGVAVSGGPDSVCMLHVLLELGDRLEADLAVVHVDHRLRGVESTDDAAFVRTLAQRNGLEFHLTRINPESLSSTGNMEENAREARLEFFRRLIEDRAVDRIATGHTLSDQAETVLFRFLRGAGTAGLSGILPVTAEGLVRPLIETPREFVMRYLEDNGHDFRTDRTNADTAYSRNRIRHSLIPQLRSQHNPAIEEQLAQIAEIARAEESYWQRVTREALSAGVERSGSAVTMKSAWLHELEPALARRVVRAALREVKGDLRQIEFAHVEQVLKLAGQAQGHGRRQIPGLDIFRSFDWIRIATRGGDGGVSRFMARELLAPGETALGPIRLLAEMVDEPPLDCAALIDAAALEPPLTIRFWLPGDQYQPAGAARPVKIKEMFQEARVPLWERRYWPVLESGGRIVWSRRFGVAEDAKPSGTGGPLLAVRELPADCRRYRSA